MDYKGLPILDSNPVIKFLTNEFETDIKIIWGRLTHRPLSSNVIFCYMAITN
jgi:hypothetical protein